MSRSRGQPHGGVLAVPALLAVLVDQHEAVAGQAGVHALAERAVRLRDGAVVEQERGGDAVGRHVGGDLLAGVHHDRQHGDVRASKAAACFSISAIWTRQDSHPAPSLKYRSTLLPRKSDRVTSLAVGVGEGEVGGGRSASEDWGAP